ncbi:hypothetical protein AAC387_Pa08g2660 [Persea americana]
MEQEEYPTMKQETMEGKDWIVDVHEKLAHMDQKEEEELWKKHSIYKVPKCFADIKSYAYKPRVVSFGPYHHGESQLKQMEEHKQRALLHLLRRTNKRVEDYTKALKQVLPQLMDSYEGLDDKWRDETRFLQLMVMDGCFMLEILLTNEGVSNNYASNDPIFSNHGKLYNMPYIRRDMLMIENQIPLLVLEKLVEVDENKPKISINKLILKFCNASTSTFNVGNGLHVLDIVRKSMLQGPKPQSSTQNEQSAGDIIRSATELQEAGIRFKKSKTESLRDIKFKHGILSLPGIIVDDITESTLLNLMAYERLHVGAGSEVTSYVFFMDNIIDSARDVSLLHSKGIIQNAMGSDKAVAKLFNELSKDVTLDPESSLDEVHKLVHDYCKKSWNEWRANLIHTYFRSPWAFLSLLAALFLLLLTVAQTVYTILSYHHPMG